MARAGTFTPEKLVMGILSSRPGRAEELVSLLVERWGRLDYRSPPTPFMFTTYYDREMGQPIERVFLSFERLIDPGLLARIKQETSLLEDHFREDGQRKVNLDPGLMALSRFSLATTKESAHRIPLACGIYAEITLLYARGGFRPLDWTYPDFRSELYLSILNEIRALYKSQLSASAQR
jgi:hypothetical protein